MIEQRQVAAWWKRFMLSVGILKRTLPRHRHEDQFLRVYDGAIALASSDRMADEIAAAYARMAAEFSNSGQPGPGRPRRPSESGSLDGEVEQNPADLVAMELHAFSLAVDVHTASTEENAAKPGATAALRRMGKTILGSVKDVFAMSGWGKAVLTVLEEMFEIGTD